MALVDIRQRAGYLFLAVMVGHVVLISAQVNARSGVPVLEAVTFGVFAEVQRGTAILVRGVGRAWSGYVGLRQVRSENDALRQELAEAKVRLQELHALADRSRGLERLLQLRDTLHLETVAAAVIASGALREFKTISIDKGTQHGLAADMAVIAPAGVVGRIVVPTARAAKVQLLIDRDAAAAALIERSRTQGMVIGGDPGGLLRMEYLAETADVVAGDVVVTSGIDGIFPKGFVIGRVEVARRKESGGHEVIVRPAVDFTSLEELLVVVTPPPRSEAAAESGP